MMLFVARAKTLTGLFFQFLRMRWDALGKRGKLLLVAGLVLAGAGAFHLGACYLGGCPYASPCSAPCEIGAADGSDGDEPCPCPYAAAAAESEAAPQADVPPCQRR